MVVMPAIFTGLASCTVIDIPAEKEIGVDANGHFIQNLSYDLGSGEIRTYKIDGSFTIEIRSYDAGSGTVKQTDGYMGTYRYDTTTKTLNSTFEKVFIAPDWITLNATAYPTRLKTRVEHYSFFDHNVYENYLGALGSYTAKNSYALWNGSSVETTSTVSISTDLKSLATSIARKAFDTNGTVMTGLLDSYKEENSAAIDHVNPQGTTVLLPNQSLSLFYYAVTRKTYAYTGGAGDYASNPYLTLTLAVDGELNYSTSSDGLTLFRAVNGSNGFARSLAE